MQLANIKANIAAGMKSINIPFGTYGSSAGYGSSGSNNWGSSDYMNGKSGSATFDYKTSAGPLWLSSVVLPVLKWQIKAFIKAPMVVNRRVKDPQGDRNEVVTNHPLLSLLRDPYQQSVITGSQQGKRQWTASQQWAATLADWDFKGNAYWLIERNNLGQVSRLRWIPASAIWPVRTDPNDFISFYAYQVGATMWKLMPSDVIHFADGVDPGNEMLGLAAWATIDSLVWTDNEATVANAAMMRNMGLTSVVFSPPDGADEIPVDQAESIKNTYQQRTTGDNRGMAMVFRFPLKMQTIGHSPKDMGFREQHLTPEERVCAAVGISPITVGFQAGLLHGTMKNTDQAEQASYTNGILPLHDRFGEQINIKLMPLFGDAASECIGFDYSGIQALTENVTAIYERNDKGVVSGWVTPNEARQKAGFPAIDGGDQLAGVVRITRNELAPPPAVAPDPETDPESKSYKGGTMPGGDTAEDGSDGSWITVNSARIFIHNDAASTNLRPGMKVPTMEERAALGVSPKARQVQVAKAPDAELQAMWKDSAGRDQYQYSAEHSVTASADKFARGRDFDTEKPQLQESIQKDIEGNTSNKEEALALSMLDRTGLRVGSDADTGAKVKAYGITTLRAEHVTVEGDEIHLKFIGKKGQGNTSIVVDKALAKEIGPRVAAGGRIFNTNQAKVSRYLGRIDGDFQVKDFRTNKALDVARKTVKSMPEPKSEKEFHASRMRVATIVSQHLCNKPKMALTAYIDPHVFGGWAANLGMSEEEFKSMRALKTQEEPYIVPKITAESLAEEAAAGREFYETNSFDKLPTPKEYFAATGDDIDDENEDNDDSTVKAGIKKRWKARLATQ